MVVSWRSHRVVGHPAGGLFCKGAKPMSTDELSTQERIEKRAHWEAFEQSVPCAGKVNIANTSYGDETKHHIYTVSVTLVNGEPRATDCTCPFRVHQDYDGPCKHMVVVDGSPLILFTARPTTETEIVTDGGVEILDGSEIIDQQEITGPHDEWNKYDELTGYTYWRCETCAFESLDREVVENHCECVRDE